MIKSFAPPVPTGGGFAFGAAPKESNQHVGVSNVPDTQCHGEHALGATSSRGCAPGD